MKKDNNFALQLHSDICISCQVCESACSYGAIKFTDIVPLIDEQTCRLCSACVKACPVGALEMDAVCASEVDNTSGVWVLAEVENDGIAPVTLELLGKATDLAQTLKQKVEVILIGTQITTFAQQLIEHGADCVHVVENPIFDNGIDEHQVQVVESLVKKYAPTILLVGATEHGRGISARLAGVLKTGLTADCTALNIDPKDRLLLQHRPAFGGNLMATISTPIHRPQMASVRPGVMTVIERDTNRVGEVVIHDFSAFKFDDRICLLDQSINAIRATKLSESRIIIGVGRGVKDAKTLARVHLLARKLGAVVAATRAAVEMGLVDVSLQIGQTGQTIDPDLYVAIGISGQIQHTSAISGSKQIIAINSDPSAPIFNCSDYGLVGSVETILPQLINSL